MKNEIETTHELIFFPPEELDFFPMKSQRIITREGLEISFTYEELEIILSLKNNFFLPTKN